MRIYATIDEVVKKICGVFQNIQKKVTNAMAFAVEQLSQNCGDCSTETQLHSLAEFVTVGKEPTDIAVGRSFPIDTFEADTRCKKDPLRRFVRGIKEGNQFNYKPSCWHYSWRSNKHATDTKHFLRVVTFQVTGATMTCVSTVDTTKFTLFSSKILDKTTSKRRAPVVKQKMMSTQKKQKIILNQYSYIHYV